MKYKELNIFEKLSAYDKQMDSNIHHIFTAKGDCCENCCDCCENAGTGCNNILVFMDNCCCCPCGDAWICKGCDC